MTQIIHQKRASIYTLARVSELEALARAKTNAVHIRPFQTALKLVVHSDLAGGASIQSRLELAMSRLAFKINDAIHLSRVHESPVEDCIDRIKRVLPKVRSYQAPPNVLKTPKLKEADNETKTKNFASGFIDDDEWEKVVDDYLDRFIPPYRGPDTVFDSPDFGPEHGDEFYGWEVERELTHDFVSEVRDGKSDAANEAGISDFIFIAVIDDRTDECCLWRHGLTLAEIEAQLDDHEDDDGDCDGTEPPLHFNCRCSLSPMIDDMPEQSPSNESSFEDWLNG